MFELGEARLDEILAAPAFQCHKTVDYSQYDDAEARAGDRPQQCAGLMAVLHRSGQHNQIMQVAERLTDFDPASVDPDGVAYASIADARAAHVDGKEPE
ncbi:hypothetical protein vBEliSR6L_69 [Erythrobacter phage vB_EliS_R6L]|nr:hypothetical protein vBEliSR6L_69 [Erythrobacter phage vB_EliS_R6L]